MNKNKTFSSEYIATDSTDIDTNEYKEIEHLNVEEEFDKNYEISKPKRIIIRGKVIDGKD